MSSRFDFLKETLLGKAKTGISSHLENAIAVCVQANKKLPAEIDLQDRLIEECKKLEQKQLIDGLLYKKFLTRVKIPRAHAEAQRRYKYLQSLDTEEKRRQEMKKCANGLEGLLHFVEHWAWTEDSRKDAPLSIMPFEMFDFQRDLFQWIYNSVYRFSNKGLVEKSRDMGVTWTFLIFIVHQVLFTENFNALLASYKEEEVDSKDNPNTLFERMRFIVKHLPEWMLPVGFTLKKHMPDMKFVNPVKGSSAIGKASTQDVGRSARLSMILLDEFASFPEGGFQVWSSVAYSASAIFAVSTPKGKLNKFAKLRFTTQIPVKRLHWRAHPWKNDVWYEMQKLEMSQAEIAQELDINYEASQQGLVFPEFNAIYHVITWTEFIAFFGESARASDGTPQIPYEWPITVRQDVGFTAEHRCVTTWCTRPTASYPLNDSFFFFREYVSPLDASPLDVADAVKELEGNRFSSISDRKMSHEQKGLRMVYAQKGQGWDIWETDYAAGIAQMKAYLTVIDKTMPHPFRADLTDVEGNTSVMGRPRIYIIVSDRCMPAWDTGAEKWIVPDATGEGDFARARTEIELYHFPASEEGKPVRQQRPFKALDDAMDTWRAHACNFPPLVPLGQDALIEQRLPETLRREAIQKCNPEDWASLMITRHMEREAAKRQVEKEYQPYWRERAWRN